MIGDDMSTDVGSTLKLTECIEITEYLVEQNPDSDIHETENKVKTILNNAFNDIKDENNESPATDVTADDTDDDLDDSVPPDNVLSDSAVVNQLENQDDNKGECDRETSLKICNESGLHSSSSSKSIIIDEKDTVEIYFKTDDSHDEIVEPVAELNITSAVTVQPVSSLSVKTEINENITEAVDSENEPVRKQTTEESNVMHDDRDFLHRETDLDLYPLSADEHRNCCYRCWYSETCNACIIGLIDRIPDRCLCPCLLSCYRCLQVVLCCDWS